MLVELITAQLAIELGRYFAERAKRLLPSTQSIKTIAYSMGFNSTSGFCSAFRCGAPPDI